MTTEPTIVCRCNAVRALLPTASFLDRGTHIEWLPDNTAGTITEEQIAVELAKLQTAWENFEYGRNREGEYPTIGEQFDLLFKDIAAGTLTTSGGFYTAIKAVKDKYPKPS